MFYIGDKCMEDILLYCKKNIDLLYILYNRQIEDTGTGGISYYKKLHRKI